MVSASPRAASKGIPGLIFTEVHLEPPGSRFLFSISKYLLPLPWWTFHHLIEGTLPGDQRPLSWQMTHDRLCRSAEGKPVTLRGLGWFLERSYISYKVNIDKPGPQTHGRISKHWYRAGSGTCMFSALSSKPLYVYSLWDAPPPTQLHLLTTSGRWMHAARALQTGFLSSACNQSGNVNVGKGWVWLTCSLWATYTPG